MKKEKRECGIATEIAYTLKRDKDFLTKMLFISLMVNAIAVIGILRK